MIKQDGVLATALKAFSVLIAIVCSLGVFSWVESKYWPVVPEFVVDEQRWDGKTLTVWGYMNKVRACDFKQLMAYYETPQGIAVVAPVDYPRSKSRPPIEQRFGPIWITLPESYPPGSPVTFWVNHSCNPLWTSVSKLATFTPEILPQDKPVL